MGCPGVTLALPLQLRSWGTAGSSGVFLPTVYRLQGTHKSMREIVNGSSNGTRTRLSEKVCFVRSVPVPQNSQSRAHQLELPLLEL